MSRCTHITACLSVEMSIVENKIELKRHIKKLLRKAPKITGSERDAEVFVNVKAGHNFWTSRDCEHCEYASTLHDVVIDGEEYSKCDAPSTKTDDCSASYQTHVVISIQGDLRDRTLEQTQAEWNEFITYIEDKFLIRDYAVNIEGDI